MGYLRSGSSYVATDVTQSEFDDHSTRHENGGADEISVEGLSGDLADAQDPKSHSTSHENGGSDEINVAGLSGELADAQTPKSHANEAHSETFIARNRVATATDLTTSGQRIVGVTDTTAARTITIASSDISDAGREIIVKDESGGAGTNSNPISVVTEGAETIDGDSGGVSLAADFAGVRLYSDGSNLFTW